MVFFGKMGNSDDVIKNNGVINDVIVNIFSKVLNSFCTTILPSFMVMPLILHIYWRVGSPGTDRVKAISKFCRACDLTGQAC